MDLRVASQIAEPGLKPPRFDLILFVDRLFATATIAFLPRGDRCAGIYSLVSSAVHTHFLCDPRSSISQRPSSSFESRSGKVSTGGFTLNNAHLAPVDLYLDSIDLAYSKPRSSYTWPRNPDDIHNRPIVSRPPGSQPQARPAPALLQHVRLPRSQPPSSRTALWRTTSRRRRWWWWLRCTGDIRSSADLWVSFSLFSRLEDDCGALLNDSRFWG